MMRNRSFRTAVIMEQSRLDVILRPPRPSPVSPGLSLGSRVSRTEDRQADRQTGGRGQTQEAFNVGAAVEL